MAEIGKLLQEMMRTPERIGELEREIAGEIGTEVGYRRYKELLSGQDWLSFLFLTKMTNHLEKVDLEDFMHFILELKAEANRMFYVYAFVEATSRIRAKETSGNQQYVTICCKRGRFDIVNSLFLKYRDESRSNSLFLEIRQNIEVVGHFLLQPGRHQLSIFYSLVYQDIHPFFEDNLGLFFNCCYSAYSNQPNLINMIFELFITKYQELTDIDLILRTLCGSSQFDTATLSIVTKAYSYYNKGDMDPLINGYLDRFLAQFPMKHDQEALTELLEQRDERSKSADLINLLGERCDLKNEPFYKGAILRNPNLFDLAQKSVCSETDLAYSAIFYLIRVNRPILPPAKLFRGSCFHISCKMYVEFLKATSTYHYSRIFGTDQVDRTNGADLVAERVIEAVRADQDRYSTVLLLFLYRDNLINIDQNDLYEFVEGILLKVDAITSVVSRTALFDLLMLLSNRLGRISLTLIRIIMENEVAEVYDLLILYLGMNLTQVDSTLPITILQTQPFYADQRLKLPMALLIYSAYKNGLIGLDQARQLSEYVNEEVLFVLIGGGISDQSCPELEYLKSGEFGSELIGCYLKKKWARMVVRKMKDENVSGVAEVAERNRRSIEYEFTLHSVIEYYKL